MRDGPGQARQWRLLTPSPTHPAAVCLGDDEMVDDVLDELGCDAVAGDQEPMPQDCLANLAQMSTRTSSRTSAASDSAVDHRAHLLLAPGDDAASEGVRQFRVVWHRTDDRGADGPCGLVRKAAQSLRIAIMSSRWLPVSPCGIACIASGTRVSRSRAPRSFQRRYSTGLLVLARTATASIVTPDTPHSPRSSTTATLIASSRARPRRRGRGRSLPHRGGLRAA